MIVLSFVRFVERLGSSMQLLSVENLSLAAEVTVVLLLLSFAWPQNKSDHVESSEVGESISWEPVKVFFLQNWTHRGLYLSQWRRNLFSDVAIPPTKPFHSPSIEDDENARIPAPWQDRLTHLLNRQGFDAILNAWQSIDNQHRGASCVSMITLSTYSDLTSAHGAMVTEQAIQQIGKQLSADMSHDSLIARYLPDRFVVLHFAATTAASHRDIALFQARTLDAAFFQTAGESLQLTCNISILELESDSDVNSTMELLEEGVSEGERSGRAILSREDHVWTETPVGLESTSIEATAHKVETRSSSAGAKAKEAISSDESVANQSNIEDAQPASTDISAVASPDDIAALFAQINTQKSGAGLSTASPSRETLEQAEPKDVPSAPVVEVGEVATADDIAALFATVKPNPKPATTVIPPITPAPTVPEMDKSEAASADDIAALFATVKPTNNQANATSPAAAKAKPSETAKPVAAAVDPNEAASADDIAALFASVKPTNKTLNAATSAAAKAQPNETAKPVAPIVDPNEAASADDIAALFATVKPINKTANAASPAAAKAQPNETAKPVAPVVDPNEAASADDIAALFATVKPINKTDNTEAPAASKARPSETDKPVAPVDPSEVASADDIAALFATVKPKTKEVNAVATVKPIAKAPMAPVPETLPVGEQLNESASVDDIAALFASVKPSAQANSASHAAPATTKQATLAVPASKEELSANASLDDIEALFAAMKK